ncbi:MAG TPA: AAA family ATPase [Candidatus Paceibacterota bacterium]|nr:AAA family ATPase [Candidatus Paceibacterota bacterium]
MLKRLEIAGFKSFARKTTLDFSSSVTSVVGPNGSGKSNVAEGFRFALGEQSMKSMRGKRSEDLIWSGSNMAPRANRAAVTIVFDNTKRIFPKFEFDEVSIERAVFRDGASEYAINGSKVRLRDVQELLASANIGETGHHIISQGEADRILTAQPRERRSMLEDALGLRVFEFKKQEAERKLEKTEENVAQVEALRREIAPHIRFLAKQVERLDRAEELAKELRAAAQTYFAIEEAYIASERRSTEGKLADVSERLRVLEAELAVFEERVTTDSEGMRRSEAVRKAERELDALTAERSELAREIGRIEGALNAAKMRSQQVARDPYVKVPREDLKALREEVDRQVEAVANADVDALHAALKTLRNAIAAFFERYGTGSDDLMLEEESAAHALAAKSSELTKRDNLLFESVERARNALLKAREASMAHEETGREQNRRLLDLADQKAKTESERARLSARMGELDYLGEEMEQGKREAIALVGVNALSYEPLTTLPSEERRVQEDRKRSMERLKIRVEEAGGGGEDVRNEYKEATERETFLASELEDLARSAAGLRELIEDLDTELQKSFAEGLQKVNASFGEFFSLMFGGGGARLVLEEAVQPGSEDEEDEMYEEAPKRGKNQKPGIEISVNLPKKRVQSLMQLSGGERALTSIALIFAMSQVNPPPFLILDETDAALDEANSRRYGDMIEELSKKSQLIVITHNRETMSRAGILYGVTMGADGISKLLSVKFDEAVSVAK